MEVGKIHISLKMLWLKIRHCIFSIIISINIVILVGCTNTFNSDEPCEWCQNTKTREVEKELGGKCYVCEKCFNHCIYCENKATTHYSSVTGLEVFVCEDCYKLDMQMMIENGIRENNKE